MANNREIEFRTLLKEWHQNIGFWSFWNDSIEARPEFPLLLAYKEEGIPYLLRVIAEGHCSVFFQHLLFLLCGEYPEIPKEMRGSVWNAAIAWVEWGKKKGYIDVSVTIATEQHFDEDLV